ncbi:MAG: helix-turn-helix transcriptional regulator [Bacteriovoracaceae bacterium]|nr:helix-turn-helix transcriptional regulator [Bacteriovoracaceae bacterium]
MENNIKELRGELGLAQEQLANEVGVTRATIGSIEKGSYNPSLELAFKISRFFNLDINDVFIVEDDK